MSGRRGRDCPLEGCGPFAPWIGGHGFFCFECVDESAEEEDVSGSGYVGTDGRDEVDGSESVCIIDVSSRHSCESCEVLGEEGEVDADEHAPEVYFCDEGRIFASAHFSEPVHESGEYSEDGSKGEDIVEVGDDVVSVVKLDIHAAVSEHDSGDAADGEDEDESDGPQHGDFESDGSAPHGSDPAKDFDASGNGDDKRCHGEVDTCFEGKSDGEHVVSPYDGPDESDHDHSVDHPEVSEDGFFGKS